MGSRWVMELALLLQLAERDILYHGRQALSSHLHHEAQNLPSIPFPAPTPLICMSAVPYFPEIMLNLGSKINGGS